MKPDPLSMEHDTAEMMKYINEKNLLTVSFQ